ncbi:helix-turn-helix transcriptional regulator [Amycolatopsis sp. NPDC051071]|uniref:helix-turn-helix domain-containing protein n=1 Tax=Amycolatopsis sp. NPDC051071 TaxID=3154637 RepID=UPI003421E842
MPRPKPTPRARALAEGLRVERRAARLAMTEVADKLAWSQSTISRIETGVRPPSAEEVSALLAVYQVTGEHRDALLTLSRDIDRPNWLETRDAGVYGQAKILAHYELDATKIIESCTVLLPVLMQTPSYARAALAVTGVPAAEIESWLELRRERQKVLELKNPPKLVAYIDEGALHRQIGGPRVLGNQLRHLVSMAGRPAVDLRVVPFSAGWHPGVHVLLEFGDAKPMVYLEYRRSGLFLHRPADVEPYLQSTVDAVALDPVRSVRLIESVVEARAQRGDLLSQ